MKKNSMEQTGLNRAGLNRAELSRTALRRSGSDQSEADRADEAAVGNDMTIEEAGGDATFVVHVQYRQNATWQGRVTWAEKKQSCNFRSALELLKLIDSALDENDGAEEQE